MKRFLLLAITTIVMVGCSNFAEQDALPSKVVGTPDTIYATFDEAEADSRTYVEQGKYLRWNEGDEISFFPVTYNMQYRFKGKTGDNNGAFEKITTDLVTGNELKNNYAVYPYKASTAMSDEGIISFELPAVQHYAENSFGVGANTMVAITSGKDDNILRFKNCGGYLKLQLYGDATVKSIELKGNNGEKIAGASTITAVYGGEPSVAMADSATTYITLDCGDGVALGATADAATAFWFVVPPTTFENGFTVMVTNTEGAIFEKSTSNTTTIDRNTIQPMAEVEVKCANPENCKIYYISTGKIERSSWSNETFGANIVSNEWDETTGKGVITFDGEVTKISYFGSFNTLSELTLPKSIKSFGERAFSGCTGKLILNCNVPGSSYNSDKEYYPIFYGASFTDVVICENVTSLGYNAFRFCEQLQNVFVKPIVPPTLGSYAFLKNAANRLIYIPYNSVEAYNSASGWKDYLLIPYDYEKDKVYEIERNPITYDWYTTVTDGVYEIDAPEELVALSMLSNGDAKALAAVGADAAETFEGKTINLLADIDLSNYCGWMAGSWIPIKSFRGIFNGNNHTISNLFCKATGSTGLFLSVSGATIKDLTVQGEVTSITTNTAYVGGIAGSSDSSLFENCVSAVNVSNSTTNMHNCVGGLCGKGSSSFFIACQSTGKVYDYIQEWEWYDYVGGIVGRDNGDSNIVACCKLEGSVVGGNSQSYTLVGGIVGDICGSPVTTIQSCYTSISVSGRCPGNIASVTWRDYSSYCRNVADCYYSGSNGKGIGTNGYNSRYEYFDLGTAKSVDLAAEIVIMNEGIDEWNAAHPECICNYKYALDENGKPKLVKQVTQ